MEVTRKFDEPQVENSKERYPDRTAGAEGEFGAETAGHALTDSSPDAAPARSELLARWRRQQAVFLRELLANPAFFRPIEWDLRPYTGRGLISLLVAAPKVGKSTFAGAYAHAKATGGVFLGQRLRQGRVLIVAPDEHPRAVVERHRRLGTPPDQLAVWFAFEPKVSAIANKAAEVGADLVIVDTLGRIAGVRDENDNAEWTRWFTKNDPHVRDSSAAWLFIHHSRKSPGADGAAIRGASTIFGCVDIAFSLDRKEGVKNRRTLKAEGSRFEDPGGRLIELVGDIYRHVGDAETVSLLEDDRVAEVQQVLTDRPLTVSELKKRLAQQGPNGIPESTLYRHLKKLHKAGIADREGSGGKRNPYKYRLPSGEVKDSFGGTEQVTESVTTAAVARSTTSTAAPDGSILHHSRSRGAEERSAKQTPFYEESGSSPPLADQVTGEAKSVRRQRTDAHPGRSNGGTAQSAAGGVDQ